MPIPTDPPRFPEPPKEYDAEYFKTINKQLLLYIQRLNSGGSIRCSKLNISNLPTSATGLRSGDLWNNAGVINIVP